MLALPCWVDRPATRVTTIFSEGGAQGLQDNDVVINGHHRSTAADDSVSTTLNDASAIAKAAAINDSSRYTGVTKVEETVVNAGGDITAVTLDSTNNLPSTVRHSRASESRITMLTTR